MCADLDRMDLAECTELAVTELVTNAVLHASDPISLRVAGTFDHPRFEVADGSQVMPVLNPHMTDDEELLTTFGRGLSIVGMCSRTWGVDVHATGKIVWFEPTTELADTPAVPVLDVPAPESPAADVPRDGYLPVVLTDLPVRLLQDFRRHYLEVRRELRLLALAHETDYPVAKSLTELFSRVDEISRLMVGLTELEAAMAAGVERIDIELMMPPNTPATMQQLLELLELADEFCRSQRLLTLAATDQQYQLQRWYLGEFIRQGRGEEPLKWGGKYTVDTSYRQSAS